MIWGYPHFEKHPPIWIHLVLMFLLWKHQEMILGNHWRSIGHTAKSWWFAMIRIFWSTDKVGFGRSRMRLSWRCCIFARGVSQQIWLSWVHRLPPRPATPRLVFCRAFFRFQTRPQMNMDGSVWGGINQQMLLMSLMSLINLLYQQSDRVFVKKDHRLWWFVGSRMYYWSASAKNQYCS